MLRLRWLVVLYICSRSACLADSSCFADADLELLQPDVCPSLAGERGCCGSTEQDWVQLSMRNFLGAVSVQDPSKPEPDRVRRCGSVFNRVLCGRCHVGSENGLQNRLFNIENRLVDNGRPNLIVCRDVISMLLEMCEGLIIRGIRVSRGLLYE